MLSPARNYPNIERGRFIADVKDQFPSSLLQHHLHSVDQISSTEAAEHDDVFFLWTPQVLSNERSVSTLVTKYSTNALKL